MANAFDTFNSARDSAFNQVEQVRQNRALRQAGQSLQGGDMQGAIGGLQGSGMLDQAGALQRQQQDQQDRTYQQGRDAKNDAWKETERKATVLKDVTEGLKTVSAGQRKAQLDRVLPVFQKIGIDVTPFQGLTEEDLSDAGLAAFGAEIDKQLQVINLGNGGVATFNNRTGEFKTLREPVRRLPPGYMDDGQGGMVIDPNYVAGQGAVANAKAGATAAHRAPRASGGGGGASGLPAGFVVD